jgi:hypothetical protein
VSVSNWRRISASLSAVRKWDGLNWDTLLQWSSSQQF